MKSKKIGNDWICYVNFDGKYIECIAPTYLEALQGVVAQIPEGARLWK